MVSKNKSDEAGRNSNDLPKPSEDPTIKYCHEGKQYNVSTADSDIEIVKFDPDGPCGGIVVIDWVDTDGHPLHEHQRDDAGISKENLDPYLEKYEDKGGVITANLLLREIRELNILEVDPRSYDQIYYDT